MSIIKQFSMNEEHYRVTDRMTDTGYTYFDVQHLQGRKWIVVFSNLMTGDLNNRWSEIMQFLRIRSEGPQRIDDFIKTL